MTIVIWTFGFLTGILLYLAAGSLFLFKLILQPKLQRKLPEFIKPRKLSAVVVNEIRDKLVMTNEDCEETALWLNAIINWLFLNLFDSAPVQTVLNLIVSEIAVDFRRSPLGHLLTNSELKSIEIGGCAPRVERAQIITGSSLKDPSSETPLTIKFDLEYDGECRVVMSFDTIFGLNLACETLLKTFKGSFILVIQDRTLHYCFLSEPEILEIDTNVYFSSDKRLFYQVPLLNRFISGRLIKKLIKLVACFPKFLGQWYRAGPEQPPYPWNPSVKVNPELLYNWTQKMD